MERRLQLLLDAARYDKIATEARQSGRSVAAVIREAIDNRFPDDDAARRMRGARELLEMTAQPGDVAGESPSELKEAYAEALEESLS